MTLNDSKANTPAGIGHNSTNGEIEQYAQALEQGHAETLKPRALPIQAIRALVEAAQTSDEDRDTLADVVQGEIFDALTGVNELQSGAGLAGASWLRDAIAPTILLTLVHQARVNGDVAGAFVAYVLWRCAEAAQRGQNPEFRASDAEIAEAIGVSAKQVRLVRQNAQQGDGILLVTMEVAERSKPRYSLSSVPAIAAAGASDVFKVLDRMTDEGRLNTVNRPARNWGNKASDDQTAPYRGADVKSRKPAETQSAPYRGADLKTPKNKADEDCQTAPYRGADSSVSGQSATYRGADAEPLKGVQKPRARTASCSNVRDSEPVSTAVPVVQALPADAGSAGEEEPADAGPGFAVRAAQEDSDSENQSDSRARQGAPARAQSSAATISNAIVVATTKIIDGEILAPAAAQPSVPLVPSPSGNLDDGSCDDTRVSVNEARRSIRARYPSGKILTIGWSIISAAAREAGVPEGVALFNAALFVSGWVTPEDWRKSKDGCYHPSGQILPALVKEFRKAKGSLIQSAADLQKSEAMARANALALPGPNGEKMQFRDDEKLPAPPHMAAPTGYLGNLILQAAREHTDRTPVTCGDVIRILPTLTEADRTDGDWIKHAGFLAYQVAAQREVAGWRLDDGSAFVDELQALAPAVPRAVIAKLAREGFKTIGSVGLYWSRDDHRTIEAVTKALKEGMPKLAQLHALHEVEWVRENLEQRGIGTPSLDEAMTETKAFGDSFEVSCAVEAISSHIDTLGTLSAKAAEAAVIAEAERIIERRVQSYASAFPEKPLVTKPLKWRLPGEPPAFAVTPDKIWKQISSVGTDYHN